MSMCPGDFGGHAYVFCINCSLWRRCKLSQALADSRQRDDHHTQQVWDDPIFLFVFEWGMMGATLAAILGQTLTAVLAAW